MTFADDFAKRHGISVDFMQATEHDYHCECPICLDWWVDMGPDGYDNFGPFTWQQVEARARERGEPFTRGVKDE